MRVAKFNGDSLGKLFNGGCLEHVIRSDGGGRFDGAMRLLDRHMDLQGMKRHGSHAGRGEEHHV